MQQVGEVTQKGDVDRVRDSFGTSSDAPWRDQGQVPPYLGTIYVLLNDDSFETKNITLLILTWPRRSERGE